MKSLLVFGLAFLAPLASADIIYSYTGTTTAQTQLQGFPAGPFTFTFTSPSFITADLANVVPGSTLTCSACDFVSFLPSHPQSQFDAAEVAYDFAGIGTAFSYFPAGSFQALGVYVDSTSNTAFVNATLTVTSSVPEPSSEALFALGVGGLFMFRVPRRGASVTP